MNNKMPQARQKVEEWVNQNPDGYLKHSLYEIAKRIGVSVPSVDRHLMEIIAARDECLPSEVIERRRQAGFRRSPKKMVESDVNDIRRYHDEGLEIRDIVFITGYSIQTVRKHIKLYQSEKEKPAGAAD